MQKIGTINKTREILERNGFFMKKKFGQNFLIDQNILSGIVSKSEINKSVNVIEIGPGIGSLTEHLLENANKVISYEIDNTLIPILTEQFSSYDNFTLINQDILKANIKEDIEKYFNDDLPVYVVANLPYYITTPIIMHLLENVPEVKRYAVMVQLEVADRIVANKGGKDYNNLSIAINYRAKTYKAINVSRNVFMPKPNVDSAVVIFDIYDRLNVLKDGATEEVMGLKSGFSGLDQYIVGFGKSDLIIVGARPGVGKTAFVLNIATNIAKRKKKAVAIFNLEMAADQLVQRIISSEALVDSQKLRQGNLNTDDWEKIANATSELSETDILIDANPSITVTSMKAKLRRIKNLGLVVVDYLQLMQSERKNDPSRVNQVGEISRGLKIMAKELQVPVIVCAQLSRSTEKEHKKPMLSDLRESGSIEQDADMVMFLSRDYYGDDPEKANLVDVILAKNRHGSVGTVQMSWLGQYTKFSTLDESSMER